MYIVSFGVFFIKLYFQTRNDFFNFYSPAFTLDVTIEDFSYY
ncbi:hypothetical protein bcere0018_58290 [Bacillus cereus Rock1-15]|nr:hypothetical protein bcere0018_58290 [Bacillus cereus Rock1-15]